MRSPMQCRYIALATLLFAVGCGNKAKDEASQAAAAKSAEEAEIDQRARVVAQDLIQKAADDAEKKRQAAEQQKADAIKQLQQDAMAHPGKFLASNALQTAGEV